RNCAVGRGRTEALRRAFEGNPHTILPVASAAAGRGRVVFGVGLVRGGILAAEQDSCGPEVAAGSGTAAERFGVGGVSRCAGKFDQCSPALGEFMGEDSS